MPFPDRKIAKKCLSGQTILTKALLPPDWLQSWAKTPGLASRAEASFQPPFLSLGFCPHGGQSAQSYEAALSPFCRPRASFSCCWQREEHPPRETRLLGPLSCTVVNLHSGGFYNRGSERSERKTNIYWAPPIYISVTFHGVLQTLCGILESFLSRRDHWGSEKWKWFVKAMQ